MTRLVEHPQDVDSMFAVVLRLWSGEWDLTLIETQTVLWPLCWFIGLIVSDFRVLATKAAVTPTDH